jgi:hypothetical protein
MQLKRGTKTLVYVFLAPLFKMPHNAILVSPTNTFYSCHETVLISYLHHQGYIDLYAFGDKNEANGFKVVQRKDWGFYQEDATANYLRHKSKSKGSS